MSKSLVVDERGIILRHVDGATCVIGASNLQAAQELAAFLKIWVTDFVKETFLGNKRG